MNVETYTIIFLKKQKYLNLPGIGNFKLYKEDGDEKVSFSPVPIIDDMFASFIGVNENVSSNNAANAISRYAKEIKNNLNQGKVVSIPGLGLLKSDGQNITFEQESEDTFLKPMEDKQFRELSFGKGVMPTNGGAVVENLDEGPDYQSVPNPDENITFETETYNPAYDEDVQREQLEKKEKQKKLTRSLLTTVLILAIIGILVWAFYSFLNRSQGPENVSTPTTEQAVAPEEASNPAADSTAADSTAVDHSSGWHIVTKTYDSEISADKRLKQLSDYGWDVSKESSDNGNYNIVVNIANDGRKTEDVVDSVRKVLNPSGKVYLKK